jgi:autotransporter translocation and assembly factor TamB
MRGRVRGLAWNTSGGSAVDVRPNGDVRVHKLVVKSRIGTVKAEGSLFGGMRVWVERLTIAELAKAAQLPPPYPQGVVDLEAEARQVGKSFRGTASGTLVGFALAPDRPTLGGRFDASLGRRDASLTGNLAGKGIGKLDINAATRVPRDQLDPVAWKRMGSRAMKSARATLSNVRVAGAMRFAGEPVMARGVISGSLQVDDQSLRATGEISAQRLRVIGVRQRINASARFNAEGGRLTMRAIAGGRGLGQFDGQVEAHIPNDLGDVERWKRMDEYSIAGITLDASKFSLARIRQLVPTMMPPINGTVEGRVVVAKHATSATITGSVAKLYNAKTATRPVDATIRAFIDDSSSTASLNSRIKGTPLANGRVSLAAGIRTFHNGGVEALTKARLDGSIKVSRLPLRMVADAAELELRQRISGALVATANISGSAQSPRVVATADLSGARVDRVQFRSFDVRGELGDRAIVASATATQRSGGRLDAVVNMERLGKQRITGSVTAKDFELAFLRGLDRGGSSPFAGIGGRAFASVQVAGTAEKVEPRGTFRLTNGKLRPPDPELAPLSDINVTATFDSSKLEAKLSARSGNGSLWGTVNGTLRNQELVSVTGRVRTRRYPYLAGEQTVKIDSDTRIKASPKKNMWDVSAYIASATVRVPDPLSKRETAKHSINAGMSDVIFLDDPKRRRKRRKLRRSRKAAVLTQDPSMRIKINAPGTIRLRGPDELIKAQASANLIVTMVGDDAIIQGEVRTTQGRDRVKIIDRQYEIEVAEITFDGQVPPDPRINLRISHAFETLTLRVTVRGRASKIEPPQFSSDPGGFDRATLLGYFLGRDPDNPAADDTAIENKAAALVVGYFASKAQDWLRDYLPIGLDVLNVETDVSTRQVSRVTVGKWINDDLFVAYRYSPTADDVNNTNEAQVEYRLTRRWSLEGTYGDNGKGGLDILWIRRF